MSDYFDRDRSELGDGLMPETQLELDELAAVRGRATGRVIAVATFTGSDTCTLYDDEGGLPPEGIVVPLDHPSPSLALDVVEGQTSPEFDRPSPYTRCGSGAATALIHTGAASGARVPSCGRASIFDMSRFSTYVLS